MKHVHLKPINLPARSGNRRPQKLVPSLSCDTVFFRYSVSPEPVKLTAVPAATAYKRKQGAAA